MIGDGGGLHICVRVIFVDIGSKFKNLAMYFSELFASWFHNVITLFIAHNQFLCVHPPILN